MLSTDIFKIIDDLIPKKLALPQDKIGYFGINYKNTEISKIKIMLDILPEDDIKSQENELIITHYPPTFTPKIPTYVINTNWDVIDGGSSDALAQTLNLDVLSELDKNTKIGRICAYYKTLNNLLLDINDIFGKENMRIANKKDSKRKINRIAILPGSGLSNKNYIKLAKENGADIFLSGDLSHNSLILAQKLDITLIDIPNYYTQLPGLYVLAELLSKIGIPIEVVDKGIGIDYF